MAEELTKKKTVDLSEGKFNLWTKIENRSAFLHDPPALSEFDPEFIRLIYRGVATLLYKNSR